MLVWSYGHLFCHFSQLILGYIYIYIYIYFSQLFLGYIYIYLHILTYFFLSLKAPKGAEHFAP